MSECTVCLKAFIALKTSKGLYCSQSCSQTARRNASLLKAERGEHISEKTRRDMLHEKFGGRCQGARCAWDFDRRMVRCHVEHIDGNPTNNFLSNLTLLCANCHSLTPTYKNKNKGNGRAARDGRAFQ